ncbi:Ig-like domain-containing protein [Thiolinea disciformis]|uniref:Ig-like domain-containing protein n=1 Tax=Thiolinea disciformis TaxID=125614 RepID=UPI00037998D3|nr:Ig-like domain-containing protein [Thiolinea disciformis]
MTKKSTLSRQVFVTASVSILLAFSSASWAAPNENAMGYGLKNPITVDTLPEGDFKKKLKTLPPQSQKNAEKWLNKINFHKHDLQHMRVDKTGGIYFADTFTVPPPTAGSTTTTSATDPVVSTITALTDVFKLHSKKDSKNTIYLDFNGETISNTAWNNSLGVATYNALPYDTDGVADTFSSEERTNIASIWRRVAEDFAPFDVNITTEAPSAFTNVIGHLLVTKSVDANGVPMPSTNAGGVAYLNVWGSSSFNYYSPAFAYYNNLYDPDVIAEAASHEIGHNLGLSHDGSATGSYYWGHGTGNISWAPIMGAGYYKTVTQWSKGEYTGANQTQDDLAIISSKLPPILDDHGNQASQATALIIGDTGYISATTLLTDPDNLKTENKGIIDSNTDVDFFKFNTNGGLVTLQATPAYEPANTRGANLDIALSLYDSNGNLITDSNPADDTDAGVSLSLAAGTYYLAVKGSGSANYSNYASLGQYTIQGQIPPTVVDTTPPNPNPMGWSVAPKALDSQSIQMTAVQATDDRSSVEYYFDCTSSGAGCVDSGWIPTNSYTLKGLSANTAYSFTVKARDASGNETGMSATASATTAALPNQAPVAMADIITIRTKAATTIDVLRNDSDPDKDPLTITSVSAGQRGLATLSNNTIVYQAYNLRGSDTLSYVISDGHGHTATTTVTIKFSK